METAAYSQKQRSQQMLFISGRISLDLSHTGGKRTTQGMYFERLHQPKDFSNWLAKSELDLSDVVVSAAELEWAHELREAIWYAAHAIVYSKPIEDVDLEIINRYAAFDMLVLQLNSQGMAHWRHPITVKSILAYIARDAIELIGTDTKARLRECASPRCPLLFVDTSRPNKRRWCSMERCGLMEKTARFRSK